MSSAYAISPLHIDVDRYQTRQVVTLTDLTTLNLRVPALQRAVDEERVEEIISYQEKHFEKYGTFCFVGDITLFCQPDKNENYIIDGMHRYYAIKNPRVHKVIPDYKIGLNILNQKPGLTIEDAFVLINKARPVPSYVVDTVRDEAQRSLIEACRQYLLTTYKVFVSKSHHPRVPHFNADVFVSFLQTQTQAHAQEANPSLINRLATCDKLIAFIEYVNKYLRQSSLCTEKVKAAILAKSEKNGGAKPAYFCVDPHYEWLRKHNCERIYAAFEENQSYPQEPFVEVQRERKNRTRLTQTLRDQLWKKYYGNVFEGVCKCCRFNTIRVSNFEAGHILSRKEGGSDHMDNLVPICGSCNRSMGTMHMDEYARELYERSQDKSVPYVPVQNWSLSSQFITSESILKTTEKIKSKDKRD